MNLTDVLIVALVLCAAAAAGMYTWKHRNSCTDCPGSCSAGTAAKILRRILWWSSTEKTIRRIPAERSAPE